MACTLTRNDVSDIVLDVLRQIHSNPSITEGSRFGIELLVDPFARATLYPGPITERIKHQGCFLKVFGPSECQKAQDVEDIVTAAWNDVKSSQNAAAMISASQPVQPGQPVIVQPAATILVPAQPQAKARRARSAAKGGGAKKGKAKRGTTKKRKRTNE